MPTLPIYPPAVTPLDGSELVPIWQGGHQRQVRTDALELPSFAADRAAVAADRAAADTAKTEALSAALSSGYFPGARSHVPEGLTGAAVAAAGSGGTDNTYIVPLSGSNLTVAAYVQVVVTGGVITSATVSAPGLYVGTALNIGTVDLSSIPGLHSATVTPLGGYLRTSGQYYLTDHATDPNQVALFQNQANAAVEVDPSVDWLNASTVTGQAALAGHYANDNTDTDVPGGAPGDRGAKFYANQAGANASTLASTWDDAHFETIDDDLGVKPGFIPVIDQNGGVAYISTQPLALSPGTPLYIDYFESIDPTFMPDDYCVIDASGNFGSTASLFGSSTTLGTMAGDRADAPTRLNQALNAHGDARSPYWGADLLRQTHARLDALENRAYSAIVTTFSMGFVGDSFVDGQNFWLGLFARWAQNKYGFGGQGFTGCGFYAPGTATYSLGSQPGSIAGCARVNELVGWPIIIGTWTSVPRDGTTNQPTIGKITSNTPGDYVDFPFAAGHDGADLFADDNGLATGIVKYSWDGGTTWSSNVTLGPGATHTPLTGIPSSAGTLRVQVVTGSVGLDGVNFKVTSSSGIIIHKLGSTGSEALQWATMNAAKWGAQAVTGLGLHSLWVLLGTNDALNNAASPTATAANVKVILDAARAARPGLDTGVIAPYETPDTDNTTPMASYALSLREMAIDNLHAFMDLQPLFQRGTAEYGAPAINTTLYDNVNTEFAGINPDGIHPNSNQVYSGGAIRWGLRHMMEP